MARGLSCLPEQTVLPPEMRLPLANNVLHITTHASIDDWTSHRDTQFTQLALDYQASKKGKTQNAEVFKQGKLG